jgi:predicted dehydrogenase
MNSNAKICLIGHGYWGKILHKNLINLGFRSIKVLDQVLGNMEDLDNSDDYYFIATPFTTHLEVLNKLSEFHGKKIWCEKPLSSDIETVNAIYEKLKSKGNSLLVDWVYTFNPAVDYIKSILKNKEVKQVILNRTNDGPVRTDCNSIWDLSSHDISMLYTIFGIDRNFDMNWSEFSIKTHENFGSNISWSYNSGMQVIINSSWQHQHKNRISLFITSDDQIIVFDDIQKKVVIETGKVIDFNDMKSPLETALKYFFMEKDFTENEKMTKKITKTINNAI